MVACAPLFFKPVFQHVHILLVGAILLPDKRTVTQVLRVMEGMEISAAKRLRRLNFA